MGQIMINKLSAVGEQKLIFSSQAEKRSPEAYREEPIGF